MLFALVISLAVHAAPPPPDEPLVPVYVPRSVTIGVLINPPVVTPRIRLYWEGALIDQPKNTLFWTAAIGTGVGVGLQKPMTAHYQHVLLAGLGFRSDRELLFWGFQVTTGPVWYRAAFLPGSIYAFENRVLGYIEGRLQLGLRITPHFRLALYFGYGSPYVFQRQYPGNTFVGGIDTGLVVDWR